MIHFETFFLLSGRTPLISSLITISQKVSRKDKEPLLWRVEKMAIVEALLHAGWYNTNDLTIIITKFVCMMSLREFLQDIIDTLKLMLQNFEKILKY